MSKKRKTNMIKRKKTRKKTRKGKNNKQKGGINIIKVIDNLSKREDLNYPTKYEIIEIWKESYRSFSQTVKKLRKIKPIIIEYDERINLLCNKYSEFFKNLLDYLRSMNPDYINEIHGGNKLSVYMNDKRYIFTNLNSVVFPVWKDLSEINTGEYIFLLHNIGGSDKNENLPGPLPKTKAYYSISDYGVGNHKYSIPGILTMFQALNPLSELPKKINEFYPENPEIYDNLSKLYDMIMNNFIRMMMAQKGDLDNWFHILSNEKVNKIIELHSKLQDVSENETSLNDIFLFALPCEWLKINNDNRQLVNAYLTKNIIPLRYRLLSYNNLPKVDSIYHFGPLPFTTEILMATRDKEKDVPLDESDSKQYGPIPDDF